MAVRAHILNFQVEYLLVTLEIVVIMKHKIVAAVLALFMSSSANASDSLQNMKPYPSAEAGMARLVFRVPPARNENDRKVEVRIGKTMQVDCNKTRFLGSLERRVAKGWGFPYYVAEKIGGPASTMMACPEGESPTEQFVTVTGDGMLLRYNSKLPFVVYVPEGFVVRYRIWSPQDAIGEAAPE